MRFNVFRGAFSFYNQDIHLSMSNVYHLPAANTAIDSRINVYEENQNRSIYYGNITKY